MRTTEDSLLAAWGETLGGAGDRPAIFDTRGRVLRTFRQLEDRASQLEQRLLPFEAGSVVAIQIGNHPDWPPLLLACVRRGLVVLPLERTMSQYERHSALATCRCCSAITEKNSVLDFTQVRGSDPPPWDPPAPSLLKLTSGTTATPRAIRFRNSQLLTDCSQICETMQITERDLNFGVIPISHSYGLSNLLIPLIARGVPMVLSTDRMPRAVLDDLTSSNATVFPGMPVFYRAFAEMDEIPKLDRLRLCISAAAPLPVEVAQVFGEKFQRPIHSFYGSSECGGICYDREGKAESGFVGEPLQGVTLELIDSDPSSSQVRVRSKAVGDGYFPDPDEQKLGHGVFVPDDLLSRRADGFRIVGRVSDVINVAGKKVNPAEVEAELLRCDGVKEAVVFGRRSSLRNEEVAACVVTSREMREADLLEFCRHRLSGWQVPKRIFFVEAIPLNERGKTSRRELARLFLAQNPSQFA